MFAPNGSISLNILSASNATLTKLTVNVQLDVLAWTIGIVVAAPNNIIYRNYRNSCSNVILFYLETFKKYYTFTPSHIFKLYLVNIVHESNRCNRKARRNDKSYTSLHIQSA